MDTASPGMTPGPTPGHGVPGHGDALSGLADIERVGQAATEAVPGGTIIEMDADDDGKVWDVTVAGEDGTAQAMKIDAETAKVTASPSPKPDVDKAKTQELVAAAKIDYAQAAEKILGEVPGGRLTKLELETEEDSGKAVWKGEVTDEQGETREVAVDAETGDVMPAPGETPGGEESPGEATPRRPWSRVRRVPRRARRDRSCASPTAGGPHHRGPTPPGRPRRRRTARRGGRPDRRWPGPPGRRSLGLVARPPLMLQPTLGYCGSIGGRPASTRRPRPAARRRDRQVVAGPRVVELPPVHQAQVPVVEEEVRRARRPVGLGDLLGLVHQVGEGGTRPASPARRGAGRRRPDSW